MTRRAMPAWLLVLVGLLARPCLAIAAEDAATGPSGPERPLRVLPAEAAPRLEAALGAAAPAFRLQDAAIAKDHVKATVCDSAGCYAVRLDDVAAGCDAMVAGAFCVRFSGAAPTDPAPLLRALSEAPAAGFWRTIEARPAQPALMAEAETPRQRAATDDLLPDPPTPTQAPAQAPSSAGADAGTAESPTAAAGRDGAAASTQAPRPTDGDGAATGRWLLLSLLVAAVALWAILRQRKGD